MLSNASVMENATLSVPCVEVVQHAATCTSSQCDLCTFSCLAVSNKEKGEMKNGQEEERKCTLNVLDVEEGHAMFLLSPVNVSQ